MKKIWIFNLNKFNFVWISFTFSFTLIHSLRIWACDGLDQLRHTSSGTMSAGLKPHRWLWLTELTNSNAADRSVTDSPSQSVSVLVTFRHKFAFFHFQPDQQALLGGRGHWWDNSGVRGNGGCGDGDISDRGGFGGFRFGWHVSRRLQVNVCVQVRTWIGWFVFRNLSKKEVWF